MKKRRDYFECPNCGAMVLVGAAVCRECGSDDATGWQSSEEIDYQSIDIPDGYGPDDELDVRDDRKWWVSLVAILLVAMLVLWTLRLL